MQSRLHQWIPLMMLLHQHEQTREWHPKHLSKLLWVNSRFLCREHTRFLSLNISQLVYLILFLFAFNNGSSSLLYNLTLLDLILHITGWIVLPLVIDLLINESVCLLQHFSDIIVDFELIRHLHVDEFSNDLGLCFQSIDLSLV